MCNIRPWHGVTFREAAVPATLKNYEQLRQSITHWAQVMMA